jgi:hypothetical protein
MNGGFGGSRTNNSPKKRLKSFNINLAIKFSVELIGLSYYVLNRFYKFGEL